MTMISHSDQQRRKNNASMAIQWQRLCDDSYGMARFKQRQGYYKIAAYYQRQAARDFVIMAEYLKCSQQ